MYETFQDAGLNLTADTQRRLREVFAGQTCCKCGEAAVRLAGNKFYCAAHFIRNASRRVAEPKVYRCVLAER